MKFLKSHSFRRYSLKNHQTFQVLPFGMIFSKNELKKENGENTIEQLPVMAQGTEQGKVVSIIRLWWIIVHGFRDSES